MRRQEGAQGSAARQSRVDLFGGSENRMIRLDRLDRQQGSRHLGKGGDAAFRVEEVCEQAARHLRAAG